MSADERALLTAVCADPDADLPRLVYADWLDDHGRPERAELVRLDAATDRIPFTGRRTPEAERLFDRLAELSDVRAAWEDELKVGLPPNRQTFFLSIAGLPLGLCCTGKYLVQYDAVIWDRVVVGSLWLRKPSARRLKEVARTRVWNAVPALRVDADEVDAAALEVLLGFLPDGLRQLDFSGAFGYAAICPPPADWLIRSAGGVTRLAAHPAVSRLQVLNLSCAGIGTVGAASLAASPHLAGLRRLNVDGNHLSDADRSRLQTRFGDRLVIGDDV